MARVVYKSSSPYAKTQQTSSYLGHYVHRSIPADGTDRIFTITSKYNQRPDLAAYDLFGSQEYWWVFMVRNPDVLFDPIYDFTPNKALMIPSRDRLIKLMS